MKQANKLLTNQVLIIEREVLYDTENDGVCKNACIEQMDTIV